MALIASRSVVVQVEPKFGALVYCDLMVTMEMPLIAMPPYP
jgi:hypothetical protein